MSSSGVRTRYNLAINGKGFMLRGSPQAPLYIKQDAAGQIGLVQGSESAYSQMNGAGWSYFAQTDWSGGFQQLRWQDNGSFKDGQAIDTVTEYGYATINHDFTSAGRITGSHTYGAHDVNNGDLLFGTVKAGAAKLFKLTSANVLSTISAMAGISAVHSIHRFGDVSLVGMRRTSGTLKTLSKYNGSTLSGFRSSNPIVRAVRGIGIRAYIAEFVASLSGDVLSYATNLSAFTSSFQAGKNRTIPKIIELAGTPYFFVGEGRRVTMFRYDELQERAFPIYTWQDLTNFGVTNFQSTIMITGKSNGLSVAFAFNGAKLVQVFDDQLQDASFDLTLPFQYENQLHVKGMFWDSQNWFPGLYGKYSSVQYTPFVNLGNRAYGFAVTGTNIRLGYLDTTKYRVSGYVIGSQYGSQLGAFDKLLNSTVFNFKALATGQTVDLQYSTDDGATFASIVKAQFSTDGAITTKKGYFPSGVTAKNWNYKVVLCGPGTSTPKLNDFAFEFRPVPDTKRRWAFSVDAGDNVKLLNGQNEQRDGKALMSEIWTEKEAKRTVVFEDVDSFSAKIVSAMTSAATSARVDNTRLFPPKGRMRVLKSGIVEEMTFTSASGGKILGITRARKNTKARAYAANDQTDNYYTVIVSDVSEQINDTDDRRTESVARITLIET